MNGQADTLHREYAQLRQEALQLPAAEAMRRFEDLYHRAEAAAETELSGRCLSDLAVLVTPHDRTTARALLEAAVARDGSDPSVHENLAALALLDDDGSAWAASIEEAGRLFAEIESDAGLAAVLDSIESTRRRRADVPASLGEELARTLVQRVRPARDAADSAAGDLVLLLGDPLADELALRRRAEVCRQRGERPYLLRLTMLGEVEWGADFDWWEVDALDVRDLPEAVRRLGRAHSVRRCELVASADSWIWWCVACASGAVVARDSSRIGAVELPSVQSLPEAETRNSVDLTVVVCGSDSEAVNQVLEALGQSADQMAVEACPLIGEENTAAAWNRAVGAAQGDIVLFLDPFSRPDAQLLAAHLRAHDRGARSLVVGRSVVQGELGSVTSEMVQRAGSLEPQHREGTLGEGLILPAHFSMTREAWQAAGGFDESADGPWVLTRFAAELRARGGTATFAPTLCCGRSAAYGIDELLTLAHAVGRGWYHLARRLGPAQPRLFEQAVTLDDHLRQELTAAFLAEEDRAERFAQTWRQSDAQLRELLQDAPERFDEICAAVEQDFRTVLEASFSHEVQRGVLAAWAGDDSQVAPHAARRMVALRVLADATAASKLRRTLQELPAGARLLYVADDPIADLVPDDPRCERVDAAIASNPESLKQELLRRSDATHYAFLDGSVEPSAAEWRALMLFADSLPDVAATTLSAVPGEETASAQLAETAPTAVVVTNRRHLQIDRAEGGNYLQRWQARGGLVLEVRVPRENPAVPQPAVHTGGG